MSLTNIDALLKKHSNKVYYDELVEHFRANPNDISAYAASNSSSLMNRILKLEINPQFLLDLYGIIEENFTGAERERLIHRVFGLDSIWQASKLPPEIVRFLCGIHPDLTYGLLDNLHMLFEDYSGRVEDLAYKNMVIVDVLFELHLDAGKFLAESTIDVDGFTGNTLNLIADNFVNYFPHLLKWIRADPTLLNHPDLARHRNELVRGLLDAEELVLYEAQQGQESDSLSHLMLSVARDDLELKKRHTFPR